MSSILFFLYLEGNVLWGVGANLPLCLREVEPHEDTDRYGEGTVYKAGLDTKCKEHGGSGIAMKV